jgi:epoxide hydrolase-like predicted phosphatase
VTVRAIVFDIGGVLEVGPAGREPTEAFDELVARWEARLGLATGALGAHLEQDRAGGLIGAYSEEHWQERLRTGAGMDDAALADFLRDFWDAYLGTLNVELTARLRAYRPRFKTALLSNSFVGAREREHDRYAFGDLTDLIVYSHEVGVAKPEPRIYAIACERLGVRPDEVVFLDDVESYVRGARDAGMNAVLYRDNAQALAEIEAFLR